MSSTFSFLHLPPEVRNRIYAHYVTVKGGYVFNFESGKLVAAGSEGDTQPIDQALKFTCRQVAEEMRGLDLALNLITFSTGYSDEWRASAAAFHFCHAWNDYKLLTWLFLPEDIEGGGEGQEGSDSSAGDQPNIVGEELGESESESEEEDEDENEDGDDSDSEGDSQGMVVPSFSRTIAEQVAQRYPKFEPVLQAILQGMDPSEVTSYYGIVPSYRRQAVMYTLELAIRQGTIPKDWLGNRHNDPVELLALFEEFPPWSCCLTEDEIHEMSSPPVARKQFCCYWKEPHIEQNGQRQYTQGKYRFSAAAVATRFLSRMPKSLRLCLRNIRLREDAVSVANPECHAQGLIEFCVENPKLHIERRLDLWRNVFQSPSMAMDILVFIFENQWEWSNPDDTGRGRGLCSYSLTESVALWITEALALVGLGMPKKSFTLILDAGEAQKECAEIFQTIVQRDAAWQTAWEMIASESYPEETFFTKRLHRCYRFDGFPEAIKDMINNPSGFVQCTFDIGADLWDAHTEFQKYRHLPLEESIALPIEKGIYIQPPPPLPGWSALLAENILPEFFTNQELRRIDLSDRWWIEEEKTASNEEYEEFMAGRREAETEIEDLKAKRAKLSVERLAHGFEFFGV
ncbi:uncharacterized protein Triagg1_3886 [Trichoderma aggressivum f. europaeum]|uniref:Uncharacterized protein n=1 Tax=Trichoderma aggressivum f. europaeum TaxID=173218 RepID=A0AAE1M691_9HYPO|nr:hypothetical protein Triagg1_3886 [Trichoderma aggressivum f. europaeum]